MNTFKKNVLIDSVFLPWPSGLKSSLLQRIFIIKALVFSIPSHLLFLSRTLTACWHSRRDSFQIVARFCELTCQSAITLPKPPHFNHMASNHIWILSNSSAMCGWMPVIYLLSSSAYYGICMLMCTGVHEPPSAAALRSGDTEAGRRGTAREAATLLSFSIKKKIMTLLSVNPLSNSSLLKMVLGMKVKPHGSLQGA